MWSVCSASNNALVNTSLVAGSMGMAQYLMSSVYAYHVHDGTRCFGQDCFKTGFLICAALCLASTFACLLLSARTRKLYRQLRRCVSRSTWLATALPGLLRRAISVLGTHPTIMQDYVMAVPHMIDCDAVLLFLKITLARVLVH